MKGKAIARFVRFGSRKVGQIMDTIRGKKVSEAYNILKFINKGAKPAVEKALKSAVANFGTLVDENKIYVNELYVGQGPVLKRLRPMAMGKGAMYRRQSCHITIVVGEKAYKKKGEKSGSKSTS